MNTQALADLEKKMDEFCDEYADDYFWRGPRFFAFALGAFVGWVAALVAVAL